MAQNQYQEPIEKEDLDTQKKFVGQTAEKAPDTAQSAPGPEEIKASEVAPEGAREKEAPGAEKEKSAEPQEEQVSEKLETARQVISSQKPQAAATVSDDAKSVSEITEYEKKIEKLTEIALQKGPEHAIRVARHLDKGKDPSQADNYTLDAIHDKLLEEELRKQLIQKGLLKEL
jgi:hypothetical protein